MIPVTAQRLIMAAVTMLGVAIILALGLWIRMRNTVGHDVQTVADGALGLGVGDADECCM